MAKPIGRDVDISLGIGLSSQGLPDTSTVRLAGFAEYAGQQGGDAFHG
jgi:hypothetical protein